MLFLSPEISSKRKIYPRLHHIYLASSVFSIAAAVCPFHYNHWSCDGMKGGGRDWTKNRYVQFFAVRAV
jgi:hypothetical protein